MRKWGMACLWIGLIAMMPAQEQEAGEEQLPQWDEDHLTEVQEGKEVPGSSLMGRLARERLFSDEGENVLDSELEVSPDPEEVEEEWPTAISEQFHDAYFRQPPGGYLIDPQHLLTPQEKRDREGFLAYHAKDSAIDMFFYLFDAKQELPEGESAQALLTEHFGDRGPVAVVFYFLGKPERTQLALSSEVARLAMASNQKSALTHAIEEAFERSHPVIQIESFSVQLSIRLYWVEKELFDLETHQSSVLHHLDDEFEVVEEGAPSRLQQTLQSPQFRKIGGGVALLLLTGVLAIFAKWLADRRRVYMFPDSEGSLLLEAPHAAGVGAMITYHSPSLPPSLQRDDVPDYLQRM